MLRNLLSLSGLLLSTAALAAKPPLTVDITYLQYQPSQGPVLSNILPEPADSGLRGSELAIKDSNTTGRFLNQHYQLHSRQADSDSMMLEQARQAFAAGQRLFVANMPAAALQQLTEQLGDQALIFNAGSPDNALRKACTANLLHTLPSRAMLADALGQWLKAKRLQRWLLIRGQQPEDIRYAESIQRAAKRFGAKVVAEKVWSFDTDLRRTAQKELPLFTQGEDYDVVIVADERGDFGEYVPFNTWLPRPVVGTQGLTPVAWHRVVEQWGAAQLQSRFDSLTGRWMTSTDYASWAAVRSIAEAVTRTRTTDTPALKNYLRGDNFQLAGFKGRKLNFRPWSGQLRQPIPLVHPRALVSQSPQPGFLHPTNELDTLGFDKPEVRCAP